MNNKFNYKNPGNKLRVIPLGGNGQVTKNMFVYEYGNDIIIVDCGMGFPSEIIYGVDMVIPDISYLNDKRDRIKAIFITHGHEDHIGALPHLIDKLSAPIYATKLTIGLIKVRLKEQHKLNFTKFHEVKPRKQYQVGTFTVEPIQLSHSIPDSVAYAISTPVGTTIHTGDYKFDPTPLDGKTTDEVRLAELGNKGVLALMSDCLRSEKPGKTLSEVAIQENFEKVIKNAKGRVMITTFSSNVSRMQQAVNASVKYNRKVCIVGRSMEQNARTAMELSFLSIPKDLLVKVEKIDKVPDKNLTIIIAGSQGQPRSALARIGNSDHQWIYIKPGDEIIFSADPIPGNQDAVYQMIDNLSRLGANVYYSDITSDFHVSGHAAQEELKLMLNLTKPKFVIPISGMYRHMRQYSILAQETGVPRENILITDEGAIIEFDQNSAKVTGKIETSNIFVDGLGVGDVGAIVLKDRKVLAEEGIVVVIITVDKGINKLHGDPDIVSRGFVYMKESEKLIKEAQGVVKHSLQSSGKVKNWFSMREKVTMDLSKFLYKKTARRPMVLPVIIGV